LMHGEHFNFVAHIVYSASGHDVDRVWVDGKLLVEGNRVLTVDEDEIRERGQRAAEELFTRRAAVLETT
jgi:5-methylthioadenosine/S-adenosylhomocysteine deaminase